MKGIAILLLMLGSSVANAASSADIAPAGKPSELALPALGKLFMTQDRRAALERQRQTNRQEALAAEGDVLTVNGIIRRSSGKTTQWINHQAQHDAVPAHLRVGESENRATLERSDVVPPGAIRVKPGKP